MKKSYLFLCLALLLLALAGCQDPGSTTGPVSSTPESTPPQLPPMHTHEYTSQVTQSTCTVPGSTVYTCACGHSFQDDILPQGHIWSGWTVTLAPTEEAEGSAVRLCYTCQQEDTQILPAISHIHSYIAHVVAPTCLEEGYTLYHCSCGDGYRDNIVAALGHSFTWVVTQQQSCIHEEVQVGTCLCGHTQQQVTKPASGVHSFGPWSVTIQHSCTQDEISTRVCSGCRTVDAEVTQKASHSFGPWEVTQQQTCLEDEIQSRACSCGLLETQITQKATGEHQWSDWETILEPTKDAEGEAVRSCQLCYIEESKLLPKLTTEHTHEYSVSITIPTCTRGGFTTYTCSCGHSYISNYTDPAGHAFQDWTVIQAQGCTTMEIEKSTCYCGEEKLRVTKPALGHSYTWEITQALSCTQDEIRTGTCACGHTTQEVVQSASGHNYEHDTCTLCGHSRSLPPVTDPQADTPYFFGFRIPGREDPLYLNGQIADGQYLAATTDLGQAAKFYAEAVTGGIKFYFIDEAGTRQYIELYKDYIMARLRYTADGTVFHYDDTLCCWYASLDGQGYYLGGYGQYEYVSANQLSFLNPDSIGITEYPAGFFPLSPEESK